MSGEDAILMGSAERVGGLPVGAGLARWVPLIEPSSAILGCGRWRQPEGEPIKAANSERCSVARLAWVSPV